MVNRKQLLIAIILFTLCTVIWTISQNYLVLPDHLNIPSYRTTAQQGLCKYDAVEKIYLRNSSETTPFNDTIIKLKFPSNNSTPFNSITLLSDDFHQLVDLYNFEFLINQAACTNSLQTKHKISGNESLPLVLILVHSSPRNFDRRQLIRQTWGSWNGNYRLMFLLGAVDSIDLAKSLKLENETFMDLVQGKFIDVYRNLTYKHVMALKWFSYYCREAKYLMKTDDDIFVNTPFLLDYLETSASRNKLLFCNIFFHRLVPRYKSKWYVSKQEYPDERYPDFCQGMAVIYSRDVAFRLYKEAQQNRYYWVDDVHITGILSQKANISLTNLERFILKSFSCYRILNGKIDLRKILVTRHNVTANEMNCLWEKVRYL